MWCVPILVEIKRSGRVWGLNDPWSKDFPGTHFGDRAVTHSLLKLMEKLQRHFDIWPRLAELKMKSPSNCTLVFVHCVSYYCLCIISQLGGAKECLEECFELQVMQPIILLNIHCFSPFWSTVYFDHAVPHHHFTPALTSVSSLHIPHAVYRLCRWQLHMLHKSSLVGLFLFLLHDSRANKHCIPLSRAHLWSCPSSVAPSWGSARQAWAQSSPSLFSWLSYF